MSVDEKRKNERNYLNNRTNNSPNKKEKDVIKEINQITIIRKKT